jgi:perosamine synthetase
MAFVALGFRSGDEVLVPDVTYVATANAVAYTGATPVLVDIDPLTWGISLEDAERHVTPRTRAIVPVHLYGVPCDMDRVHAFARRHDLYVVEDASEALGASWNQRACGTMGYAGTFSFYANKILTTGEGGAVVTNDAALAVLLRSLRGQGQAIGRTYWHERVGYNYRMTELQAAIGCVQVDKLNEMLSKRHRVVDAYLDMLEDALTSPMTEDSAPWLYTGLLPEPLSYAVVAPLLTVYGIETRPVFVPLHNFPMYEQSGSDYPVANEVGRRGISLPTWPEMTDDDVRFIVDKVKGVLCG